MPAEDEAYLENPPPPTCCASLKPMVKINACKGYKGNYRPQTLGYLSLSIATSVKNEGEFGFESGGGH